MMHWMRLYALYGNGVNFHNTVWPDDIGVLPGMIFVLLLLFLLIFVIYTMLK